MLSREGTEYVGDVAALLSVMARNGQRKQGEDRTAHFTSIACYISVVMRKKLAMKQTFFNSQYWKFCFKMKVFNVPKSPIIHLPRCHGARGTCTAVEERCYSIYRWTIERSRLMGGCAVLCCAHGAHVYTAYNMGVCKEK